jgi:hypothetical protein
VNYVYAGYGSAVGILVVYAAWIIRRGRVLRRALGDPPEDRP